MDVETISKMAEAIETAGVKYLDAIDPRRIHAKWSDVPATVFARAAYEAMVLAGYRREEVDPVEQAATDRAEAEAPEIRDWLIQSGLR